MTPTELPTVRAVLAYAEQLRARAARERAQDPYADPYSPSEAAARKVYQSALALVRRNDDAGDVERPEVECVGEAAATAISELASRVVLRERDVREQREAARRAEKRHARRQRMDRAERQAVLAGLTLGARLDRCLLDLGLLSEAPTQGWDSDRVTGSPERSGPPPAPQPPDRYSRLLTDARDLVFRLEEELGHARRRDIKEPAA